MSTLSLVCKSDPNVADWLEEYAAEAREGRLTGFVMLRQTKGGAVTFTCVGMKDRFSLLGMLSHLMHQLQED